MLLGGVLACVLGGVFLQIAADVSGAAPGYVLDHEISSYFAGRSSPAMTRWILLLTFLGSGPFLTTATAVTAVMLARQGKRPRLWFVVATLLTGALLNVTLKHAIRRPRPLWENPLVTLDSFSFPSAHAMGATMFYGVVAILLVSSFRGWGPRLSVVVAACGMIATVAFTRVYLGVHYPSDVIGGIVAGLAWLAFTWTISAGIEWRVQASGRREGDEAPVASAR